MKPKLLTKTQVQKLRFRNGALQDSSAATYGSAVKSYFEYLVNNECEDQFDVDHIKEWLQTFNSANTFNLRLQAIKEFYLKQVANKPAAMRLKMREAFETIKRRRPAREKIHGISYLTMDQVDDLSGKATERCRAFIMGLFWTGCRISEFINIRLDDCRNSDPVTIRVMGKGSKERYVYLPEAEYKRLRRIFEGQVYLLETQGRNKYHRDTISKEIKRQAKLKTGLNVHAHTFRHSKAMYMLSIGANLYDIQKALGHSDVSITAAYYLHGIPGPEKHGFK